MFKFYLQQHDYKRVAILSDEMGQKFYPSLNGLAEVTLLASDLQDLHTYDLILSEDIQNLSNYTITWYELITLFYNGQYNTYSKTDNMLSVSLQKIKAANLCVLRCPNVLELANRTARENLLASHPDPNDPWFNSDEGIQVFCDGLPEYTWDEVNDMMSFDFIANATGVRNIDIQNVMLNIINGIRLTTDTPMNYTRTIHMFGPSTLFGVGVEDKHTLSSFIQRYINKHFSDKNIRVVNHGVPRADDVDIARLIRNTPMKKSDIIIIMYSRLNSAYYFKCAFEKIKLIDAQSIFERPHDMGEIFLDNSHWNHKPNLKLSQLLVSQFLEECIHNDNGLYDDCEKHQVIHDAFYNKLSQDKAFIQSLEALKVFRFENSKKTGCIIMNANPFTLGHRALVEMSLQQVENLFVFVVQENKSFFSFEDRFEMVKAGCSDLRNVKVLPTGNYMCTEATVPSYFQREQKKMHLNIDLRNEITVFAGFVAPTLNISVRFMGSEPLCEITRQLEQQTKELLPYYGMQLVIFDRVQRDNNPISASSVRRFMKENRKEEIQKIVPPTTYNYLLKKAFIK